MDCKGRVYMRRLRTQLLPKSLQISLLIDKNWKYYMFVVEIGSQGTYTRKFDETSME